MDVAVLVSGSGSNLQALIDHRGSYRIVLVVSDRPGIAALERADRAGIPWQVVEWNGDRPSFTARVCEAVERAGAAAMILAGFMRILGPAAVERFPHRILNVHPSLLPSFPGAHAVDQALRRGVKVTGVTVHFVDEEVDHGPIIAQVPVEVLADDDEASLHRRIQAEEHALFPRVVDALARSELEVQGMRVRWEKK